MIRALMSGLTWGLNAVLISLFMISFRLENPLLAPIIASFLHDAFCLGYMTILLGSKKRLSHVLHLLKTHDGKMTVIASLIGGPLGFSAFSLAIHYIGASLTTIVTAILPAFGTLLAFLFLREKRKFYQLCALFISILGVTFLGYSSSFTIKNIWLGIFFALLCVVGWSCETVLITSLVKGDNLDNESALWIKQFSSVSTYLLLFIMVGISGYISFEHLQANYFIIASAALAGTSSFLFYFKSLSVIGASKTMALNTTYSAFGLIFSYLLLKESITVTKVFWGMLIVVSSIVSAYDFHEVINKE